MESTRSTFLFDRKLESSRWAEKRNEIIVDVTNIYFDSVLIQFLVFSIALMSCIYYIVDTYETTTDLPGLELFFFAVFLLDYIMCLGAANRTIDYVLSFEGFADLASLIPVISVFLGHEGSKAAAKWPGSWIGFLRFFRLMKLFQFVRLRQALSPQSSSHDASMAISLTVVAYQIAKLVVTIILFFMLATGAIYTVHTFDDEAFYHSAADGATLTWFDCLYFVVVSVLTVGYGDIYPVSPIAKAMTVIIILLGFSIIPILAAAVFSTVMNQPKYMGSLSRSSRTRHLCICGIVDYELLFRFLTEVFHPTHAPASASNSLIVSILSPTQPSDQVQILLQQPQFRARVQYFIGSCKSMVDLSRIEIERSIAVYILADVITQSRRVEEDSVFLSAISISRYLDEAQKIEEDTEEADRVASSPLASSSAAAHLGLYRGGQERQQEEEEGAGLLSSSSSLRRRPLTIVGLTASARNRAALASTGVDVIISVQELRYTMIGYGITYPGFLSLYLNLNRSRAVSKVLNVQTWRQPELFYDGTRFSLHQIGTNSSACCCESLRRLNFREAVPRVYRKTRGRVLLVAVKVADKILINPCDMLLALGRCESAFVIAPDRTAAYDAFMKEESAGADGRKRGLSSPQAGQLEFQLTRTRDAFIESSSYRPPSHYTDGHSRFAPSYTLQRARSCPRSREDEPSMAASNGSTGQNHDWEEHRGGPSTGATSSLHQPPTAAATAAAVVGGTISKQTSTSLAPTPLPSAQESSSAAVMAAVSKRESEDLDNLRAAPRRLQSEVELIRPRVSSLPPRPKTDPPLSRPTSIRSSNHDAGDSRPVSVNTLNKKSKAVEEVKEEDGGSGGAAGGSENSLTVKSDAAHGATDHTVGSSGSSSASNINLQRVTSFVASFVRGATEKEEKKKNTPNIPHREETDKRGSKNGKRDEEKETPEEVVPEMTCPISSKPSFRSGHIVIALSSSGTVDTLPANSLMLPLLYLIRAVRHQTEDAIIVLSERADELVSLTEEIDVMNPGLLRHVFFITGVARNPDHLAMCQVTTARVVAILRPPMAAEAAEELQEQASRAVMVNADRHTIITSLNLHMLLQRHLVHKNLRAEKKLQHQSSQLLLGTVSQRSASSHGAFPPSPFSDYTRTFSVCEVVHESNIVFLRQKKRNRRVLNEATTVGAACSRSCSDWWWTLRSCFCGGGRVAVAAADYYDWPMLAAGSIYSHTLLESLVVQVIYNPDILCFWEAFTDTGMKGHCTSVLHPRSLYGESGHSGGGGGGGGGGGPTTYFTQPKPGADLHVHTEAVEERGGSGNDRGERKHRDDDYITSVRRRTLLARDLLERGLDGDDESAIYEESKEEAQVNPRPLSPPLESAGDEVKNFLNGDKAAELTVTGDDERGSIGGDDLLNKNKNSKQAAAAAEEEADAIIVLKKMPPAKSRMIVLPTKKESGSGSDPESAGGEEKEKERQQQQMTIPKAAGDLRATDSKASSAKTPSSSKPASSSNNTSTSTGNEEMSKERRREQEEVGPDGSSQNGGGPANISSSTAASSGGITIQLLKRSNTESTIGGRRSHNNFPSFLANQLKTIEAQQPSGHRLSVQLPSTLPSATRIATVAMPSPSPKRWTPPTEIHRYSHRDFIMEESDSSSSDNEEQSSSSKHAAAPAAAAAGGGGAAAPDRGGDVETPVSPTAARGGGRGGEEEELPQEQQQQQQETPPPSFSGRSLSLDKVELPKHFIGHTFQDIFESFHEVHGAIAIALYRWPSEELCRNLLSSEEQDSSLPYAVVAPAWDTILHEADEIFILRCTHEL